MAMLTVFFSSPTIIEMTTKPSKTWYQFYETFSGKSSRNILSGLPDGIFSNQKFHFGSILVA
jgi:hypothetical protein